MVTGDRLTNIRSSPAPTRISIDYESESTFNTAFKRVMGCSHGMRAGTAAVSRHVQP